MAQPGAASVPHHAGARGARAIADEGRKGEHGNRQPVAGSRRAKALHDQRLQGGKELQRNQTPRGF
jgi:hypothetical protein